MRITCPHCGFAKEINAEQIPDNIVRVTCPDCKQPFPLLKESTVESNPTVATGDADIAESLTGMNENASETAPGIDSTEKHVSEDTEPEKTELEGPVEAGEPDKVSVPPSDEPVEPATVAARYAALLIDGMLIMIMVMTLRAGLTLLGNGIQFEGQIILGTLFMLFALTLSFAYHTLFIGVCGQTPGKMLLRIQVVTTNNSAMTYRQAMLREVLGKTLSLPLLLGYFMALFNPRHLAAHDKIADTCVIKLITESTVD